MDMPRKKGKFEKRSDGKSIFVEDPNQSSSAATNPVAGGSVNSAGQQPQTAVAAPATNQPVNQPVAAPTVVAAAAPPVVATPAPPPVQSSAAGPLTMNSQTAAQATTKPANPVIVTPPTAPLEKKESACEWKTSLSNLNIRYGQSVFRVNLRPGLDAKSPMLQQFLGHSKQTLVSSEEKAKCETENCLLIDSNFLSSLAGSSPHDYKCGEWFLVADGPAEGCEAQTKSRSLRVTNTKDNVCVVGLLTDASSSGPAPKSKVLTSSLFVTTTKAESEKPAALKENGNE